MIGAVRRVCNALCTPTVRDRIKVSVANVSQSGLTVSTANQLALTSPAYVVQQMAHFGAAICNTMPDTSTTALAPLGERTVREQAHASEAGAFPRLTAAGVTAGVSACLIVNGRGTRFTLLPINDAEVAGECAHLISGNRCAERTAHLHDLDFPFVYSHCGLP
ncbi:transposase [Paraburkholderia sp. GAS448]